MESGDDALRERTRVKAELLDLWNSDPEYRRPSLWQLTKTGAVSRQLGLIAFYLLICAYRPNLWVNLIVIAMSFAFLHLILKAERTSAYNQWCRLVEPWFTMCRELKQEQDLKQFLTKHPDGDPMWLAVLNRQ